jgi:hypothetical protein
MALDLLDQPSFLYQRAFDPRVFCKTQVHEVWLEALRAEADRLGRVCTHDMFTCLHALGHQLGKCVLDQSPIITHAQTLPGREARSLKFAEYALTAKTGRHDVCMV